MRHDFSKPLILYIYTVLNTTQSLAANETPYGDPLSIGCLSINCKHSNIEFRWLFIIFLFEKLEQN